MSGQSGWMPHDFDVYGRLCGCEKCSGGMDALPSGARAVERTRIAYDSNGRVTYAPTLDVLNAVRGAVSIRELAECTPYRACVYMQLPRGAGLCLRSTADGEPDEVAGMYFIKIGISVACMLVCVSGMAASSSWPDCVGDDAELGPPPWAESTCMEAPTVMLDLVSAFVNLMLYIDNDDPDMRVDSTEADEKRRLGRLLSVKRGARKQEKLQRRHDAMHGRTVVYIGERFERAVAEHGAGGTHATPAPHFRRGHWHRYWTGKKRVDEATGKVVGERLVRVWTHMTPVGDVSKLISHTTEVRLAKHRGVTP